MFLRYILCAAAAYLLGSISTGVLLSRRLFHDDVRKHGSGGTGATNMLRTYRLKAALLTFAGDAAKAALQETQKLSGYEKQADDMRENYADRLEILQPVLENESVYDGFKVNADYYIYDKLSEDEVVEKLYEAIY